jgi:hypothetical protein
VPGVSDRPTEASVCGLPADMVAKYTGRCVRLLDYSVCCRYGLLCCTVYST